MESKREPVFIKSSCETTRQMSTLIISEQGKVINLKCDNRYGTRLSGDDDSERHMQKIRVPDIVINSDSSGN